MTKSQTALNDLITHLTKIRDEHTLDETPYDFNHIGYEIGISIGAHLNSKVEGWDITDLYLGITQGVATHKKPFNTIKRGKL